MLAYAEDTSEQIDKSNICQNELYSKSKIKNAQRGLRFNFSEIIFDDARTFKESKKIKIIQKYIKIHKTFTNISKHGLIIGTTYSSLSYVGNI